MQLDQSIRSLIVDCLNEGQSDTDITLLISSAVDIVRSERQARADRTKMIQNAHYHLFIDKRGQRWSVLAPDLPAFCREHGLNLQAMIEVSNGGVGGREEHRGFRRGPGSKPLLNGQPYRPLPDLPEDDDEAYKPSLEQRLFKPKSPTPSYNHRPTITYRPKGTN